MKFSQNLYDLLLFISGFGLWRKKKEWIGDSLKTTVLTAAKDKGPSYCSQCVHMV